MPNTSSRTTLLWIVATAFFMQSVDTTIVNTALPSIAHALGQDALSMHGVVTAYTLTMATLTPASGWLADRFGTRRVFFVAIVVFALGSLCCAAATSATQLVVARVLQGIGGSMLLPIGRLAVLRGVPGDEYVAALAFVSIFGQIGPILGPTLGGWLTQSMSWYWVFLVNLPICAVGLVAVRRYMPRDEPIDPPPFDYTGYTLLSSAMIVGSLAIDALSDGGYTDWTLGVTAIAAAAAIMYVAHARRRANPLFRLELFREPNFAVGLAGNLVSRIGIGATPFLLPLMMQLEFGYSPLRSGLMLVPAAIAGVIAKPWIAPLVRRYGYRTFLFVNTLIVGAVIALFAAIGPDTPLVAEMALIAIFGAINSIQIAAMNSVTLKGLPHRDAASGNSLYSMVQMLSMGLGASVGSGLTSLFGEQTGSSLLGFKLSFVCVGVVTLVSAAIFRRIQEAPATRTRPGHAVAHR
ncbi:MULTISPECIES: DHA2 family efflux MFS transporter permease subunit [Burkholderia]|uniref:DHA2 family efflux MFS transporter permease subunit n=1 Tax=Burkholderia TaxID=32008 RepID=UPI000754A86D|nr:MULTISPECIES: DHA2 family efflux MFS transporter permease subunit [Burkholderia]AOJ69623.1 EmrB/QacA subfamily drug resistance transporter [Burkholderia savannae]KVG44443.1 EmrB/QacA subfamily drug resistance transporter [Burkholderia sp. MSMB0265]KVG82741.1 EmrB/QacA subfamily drug resistance transporter [Burkholderia sp. MSMB2040]KVH00451.1 EmrB/QacA subfamily drug resistance transporter [Burkholderia sp. MSMB2041]KVH01829.1 EmrB/QacA subfamily drug resistance transporter [Burkholderia sp